MWYHFVSLVPMGALVSSLVRGESSSLRSSLGKHLICSCNERELRFTRVKRYKRLHLWQCNKSWNSLGLPSFTATYPIRLPLFNEIQLIYRVNIDLSANNFCGVYLFLLSVFSHWSETKCGPKTSSRQHVYRSFKMTPILGYTYRSLFTAKGWGDSRPLPQRLIKRPVLKPFSMSRISKSRVFILIAYWTRVNLCFKDACVHYVCESGELESVCTPFFQSSVNYGSRRRETCFLHISA